MLQFISSDLHALQSNPLTPDKNCEYDSVIKTDLNKLEPHVSGPIIPDLAHPISTLGENSKKNGYPLEIKV